MDRFYWKLKRASTHATIGTYFSYEEMMEALPKHEDDEIFITEIGNRKGLITIHCPDSNNPRTINLEYCTEDF